MSKTTTKETERFARLIASTARVPLQKSYLRGRHQGSCATPESVLLFTRSSGHNLNIHPHRHFHHRNLLLLPLQGTGRVIVDEQAHELGPGRLLAIRPYQFHHYSDIEPGAILWLFVTFESTTAVELPATLMSVPDDAVLWHDIQQLVECYRMPSSVATDRSLVLRLTLILEFLRQSIGAVATPPEITATGASEQLIVAVRRIVIDNLSSPPGIPTLAKQLGLSESRLRTRFRQSAGFSIGSFQRTLRMQHAAQLLSAHNHTVAETATACGWDSSFSFSRAFKQFWGRPPKTFRSAGMDTRNTD